MSPDGQSPISSGSAAPWAVGIALWNNRALLEGLQKNLAALLPAPACVLLFDNGSADGSAAWVREHWKGAELLRSEKNLGFAEAHNRLIGRSLEDPKIEGYLAFNSDALLEKDFFATAPETISLQEKIGAVQPLILQLNEHMQPTGRIDSTGIAFKVNEGLFVDRDRGVLLDNFSREGGEVFGCTGAVGLYHRRYLEEAHEIEWGYFDRRFFAYYEDVDLAWRARRLGWRAVFAPGARAYHRRYGSLKSSPEQEKLLYRNRLWLHAKNEQGWALSSPRQGMREAANLLRALSTRPYLRGVVRERFSEAARMRRDFDSTLPKVDPRDFPA